MEDHQPIIMDEFNGHYDRGLTDDTPPNYLLDTLNLKYSTSEVSSRDGTVNYLNLANVRRFFPYKRLNENPRFLILDTSGNLYDSVTSLAVPIHTNSNWLDFSLQTINNRAYITPHNRVNGISGETVWIWDGSLFRIAGGVAPSGFTLTVTNSLSSGNVEKGFKLFAVAYETASGFITPPGPAIFGSYTASGGFNVNVASLPIGPAGTVARWVLSTKTIPNYNNNQDGYIFYFIPTGRVGDNTTTAMDFSYFDADLGDDASYLFNEFATIPAGLGIIDYNGRLCYWGIPGSEHIVYISKAGDPESIDQISGFATVYPSDSFSGVKGVWAMRGNLYMRKSGSTYQTTDNAQDPVTWNVTSTDKGIGGEVFCGSSIIDQYGSSADKMFIAHISGLYNFISAYVKPDISYNISNLWNRINKTAFNLVQVVHDPTNFAIYVAVPLDSSSVISHIFYASYVEAIDPLYGIIAKEKVKWSIWEFPAVPTSIAVDYDLTTKATIFKHSTSVGIYDMKLGLTDDYSNVLHSYGKTYLMGQADETISHFDQVKFRAIGSGTLLLTVSGEDAVSSINPLSLTLSPTPGQALSRKFNFAGERASITFEVNNAGDYFTLARLIVYANEEYAERPQ